MPDSEAFPKALAAANQALALDDSLPAGHRARAFVLNYWNWDFAQADREFQRSIELDPRDAQTHHWFATSLWSQGRVAEARQQIDLARALDPLSVATISNRALFYEAADPQGAIQVWRELERTSPNYAAPHEHLGFRDLLAHDYAGFLSEWETLARLRDDSHLTSVLSDARRTLNRSGPEAMQRQLVKDFADLADQNKESHFTAANLAMLIGDKSGALRELQLAYQHHDPAVLTANMDTVLAPLRTTKEFVDLLARWTPETKAS
jgi:tetratricopeptide (TPR) repeat protein